MSTLMSINTSFSTDIQSHPHVQFTVSATLSVKYFTAVRLSFVLSIKTRNEKRVIKFRVLKKRMLMKIFGLTETR